jgi:hypothetical protein
MTPVLHSARTLGGLMHPERGATQRHDPVGQRSIHRGLLINGVPRKMRVKSEAAQYAEELQLHD